MRLDNYSLTCLINLKQYEELGEYYVGNIYLEDNSNNISEYSYEKSDYTYLSENAYIWKSPANQS